ncbi:unnamed protein product [Caenorhabditis brenneri]
MIVLHSESFHYCPESDLLLLPNDLAALVPVWNLSSCITIAMTKGFLAHFAILELLSTLWRTPEYYLDTSGSAAPSVLDFMRFLEVSSIFDIPLLEWVEANMMVSIELIIGAASGVI